MILGDPGFLDDYAVASESTKSSEIQTELDKYITEQREPMNSQNFDTLLWWKLHSPRFPIVSMMARGNITYYSKLLCFMS